MDLSWIDKIKKHFVYLGKIVLYYPNRSTNSTRKFYAKWLNVKAN